MSLGDLQHIQKVLKLTHDKKLFLVAFDYSGLRKIFDKFCDLCGIVAFFEIHFHFLTDIF